MRHVEAESLDGLVDRLSLLLIDAETMDLPQRVAREKFEFAQFRRALAPNGSLLRPIDGNGRWVFAPAKIIFRCVQPEGIHQFGGWRRVCGKGGLERREDRCLDIEKQGAFFRQGAGAGCVPRKMRACEKFLKTRKGWRVDPLRIGLCRPRSI